MSLPQSFNFSLRTSNFQNARDYISTFNYLSDFHTKTYKQFLSQPLRIPLFVRRKVRLDSPRRSLRPCVENLVRWLRGHRCQWCHQRIVGERPCKQTSDLIKSFWKCGYLYCFNLNMTTMPYQYLGTPSQSAHLWVWTLPSNLLPQNFREGLLGLIQPISAFLCPTKCWSSVFSAVTICHVLPPKKCDVLWLLTERGCQGADIVLRCVPSCVFVR